MRLRNRIKAEAASSLLRARAVWDAGAPIFQVRLPVTNYEDELDVDEPLAAIEAIGWRLDLAGFTFVPLLTTSLKGVGAENGYIEGVYIFRRP